MTIWTCAVCGIEKPSTNYLRRHKCCSRACGDVARSGLKLRRRRAVRNSRVTTQHVRTIIDWAVARSQLGTAADLARKLGISVSAVYMYAPCRPTASREDRV